MAKLHHVKRARKAIPEAGIEVGDQYWWYKKRVNGKGTPRVCSKARPRRSEYMTSSPFIKGLMDAEDELNTLIATKALVDEVAAWLAETAILVEVMGDECRDKAASVEQGMKNGCGTATSETLFLRADHCSNLASDLREAAKELASAAQPDLSEEEGSEEYDASGDSVYIPNVVGSLVWLPEG